jgi:hypothetical protein
MEGDRCEVDRHRETGNDRTDKYNDVEIIGKKGGKEITEKANRRKKKRAVRVRSKLLSLRA